MNGADPRHVVLTVPGLVVLLGGAGTVGGIAGYWFAIGWTRIMGWLLGSGRARPP